MCVGDEERDIIMSQLFTFLGVDDKSLPLALPETVLQSATSLYESISNYEELEFAFRHTSLGGRFLPLKSEGSNSLAKGSNISISYGGGIYTWGILLPIRSFGETLEQCEKKLAIMIGALMDTTSQSERDHLVILLGIDSDDVVYNSESGKLSLYRVFKGFTHTEIVVLEGLRGKICKIWNQLGMQAALRHDVDFFVLLGDDVIIRTSGWKAEIEQVFAEIAQEADLPFGFGCVAFQDQAFPGFPTFPVVHKQHLKHFEKLLPYHFVNQGGDPYLFELYRRFNCARFARQAVLENTVGGMDVDTRYVKRTIRWNDQILTEGLAVLCASPLYRDMEKRKWMAVDVVVPTFRCDIEVLQKIVALRSSWSKLLVTFWLIVDNPGSPHLEAVKALQCHRDNYSVNVFVHKANYGASAARNTGLDGSNADWVILLDDDVTVEPELLDAYVGAIMRYPQARVLVGSTKFPEPHNLLTNAITAAGLNGSFSISERRADPPWGPTANICVRGRSSRVRFGCQYPKAGGGEDIDYCLAATNGMPFAQGCLAVPGAVAHHPWWADGSWSCVFHFLGWAEGESRCVEAHALQPHIYISCPNGAETMLVLAILTAALAMTKLLSADISATCAYGSQTARNDIECSLNRPMYHYMSWQQFLARCVFLLFAVPATEVCWYATDTYKRVHPGPMRRRRLARVTVSLVAGLVILLQDLARCVAHLQRFAFRNLLWRIDWLCGKIPHWALYNQRRVMVRFLAYILLFYTLLFHL